ncbi:calcium-binding protein, partial [Vibrio parahaemolyticus]|uniref:calcium-binding protein n=1 Tax=Vibrio parahaemolyticus TaxID=670 RepID=UPI002B1EBE40
TIRIAKGTENEGSLTFPKWFVTNNSNSSYKVELFEFSDGSELSWGEITEMVSNLSVESQFEMLVQEIAFEDESSNQSESTIIYTSMIFDDFHN